MHFCKKFKPFLFILMLVLFAPAALAGNSLHIRSAALEAQGDDYLLNADVDMQFSAKVEEAISKGFVLHFLVEFQLSKPRKYWFDDEIITVIYPLALNYHALSRQFLVTRGDQQKAFVRLDEALDDLSDIRDLKVLKKSEIDKDEILKATLLMRLDAKRLPLALQAQEDWKMSSQRLEWLPNFSNNAAKIEVNPEAKPELKLEPDK